MSFYGDNPDPQEENYVRYLAETIYWQQRAEKDIKRKPLLSNDIYANFYNVAKDLGNDYNLTYNLEAKSEALQEHFPKFRPKGKVPLTKMEPAQIGRLFLRMRKYSEQRANQ